MFLLVMMKIDVRYLLNLNCYKNRQTELHFDHRLSDIYCIIVIYIYIYVHRVT